MAKLGMDDQAVRALAGQLDGHAKAIAGLVGQIEGVVSRMHVSWHGDDATSFVNWWHNQHRPALQRAHDAITGLAQSARNNATEQDRVSAVATGGQAGPVAAHAAPHPAPATSVGAGYAAAFKASMTPGTYVGDHQCVDVFEAYNTGVVHAPYVGVGSGNGARLFYERFDSLPDLGKYYDKIPPSAPPQAGDVVVWGAQPGNSYGHIAVCTGANGASFDVVEQNAPWGAPVRDSTYTSMAHVLGYLRPKPPA
jgi:WXG100 family type VII secretion target